MVFVKAKMFALYKTCMIGLGQFFFFYFKSCDSIFLFFSPPVGKGSCWVKIKWVGLWPIPCLVSMSSKESVRVFLGGPVVKNLPCNGGDVGLIPGRGNKIPHATEQLSLSMPSIKPRTTKPEHANYYVCMPQLESLCIPTKDPTCCS